jgi:hypothetical protein|tara:strand:+ start:1522 stop:1818 length:297 start_codon:yes stop_codon:yes gene_type:complete
MCDLIENECELAEKDMMTACRQSLAHGALLATRYVLAEIPFVAASVEESAEMKVRRRDCVPYDPPSSSSSSLHRVACTRRRRRRAAMTKPRLPLLIKS